MPVVGSAGGAVVSFAVDGAYICGGGCVDVSLLLVAPGTEARGLAVAVDVR